MEVISQIRGKNPDSWDDNPLSGDEESLREMLVMAGGEEGALNNALGPLKSTVLSRAVKRGAEYKAMIDEFAAEKELQLLQMKKQMGYEVDYPLEKLKEFQHLLNDPDLRDFALGYFNAHMKAWYQLQLQKGKPPITRPAPGTKGPSGQAGAQGQTGPVQAQQMPVGGILQAMDFPKLFKMFEEAQKKVYV